MATANIKQEQRETQLDACLKLLHVFSALEIVSSQLAKEAEKHPDTPKSIQRGVRVLQDNIKVIAERSRAISLLPREPIVNEEYGDWSSRAAQMLMSIREDAQAATGGPNDNDACPEIGSLIIEHQLINAGIPCGQTELNLVTSEGSHCCPVPRHKGARP